MFCTLTLQWGEQTRLDRCVPVSIECVCGGGGNMELGPEVFSCTVGRGVGARMEIPTLTRLYCLSCPVCW